MRDETVLSCCSEKGSFLEATILQLTIIHVPVTVLCALHLSSPLTLTKTQWFLTHGNFTPKGTYSSTWRHFCSLQLESSYWHLVCSSQVVLLNTLQQHRTAPDDMNPNVNSVQAEKPCNEALR